MMAFRIARNKKAFTIAKKNFVLSSAIDTGINREIIGKAAAPKLQLVSLSNDTITRRIVEISNEIECQLLERVKSSLYYFNQWDESIYV